MRPTPIFLLLGAALLNCAALTAYPAGQCGNRVIDVGEDCDEATDQCRECRLRCGTLTTSDGGSSDFTCPAGSGCGIDGICRQRTGELDDARAAVSANVVTLQAGDFDADGRVDVLGSPPFGSAGGSRVHYFDGAGALSTTTALDVSIGIPVVANFDNAQGDDIGFAIRSLATGAFGALAGQRDRTFATIVFPTISAPQTDVRIAIINAAPPSIRLPSGLPGCGVGVLTSPMGSLYRNFCSTTILGDATELKAAADFAAKDVVHLVRTGRVFERASTRGSACGQVIFPLASSLKIISPCAPSVASDEPVRWRPEIAAVTAPLPGELAGDIYVGPVTTLDRDEILVQIRSDDPGKEVFFRYDPDAPADKPFVPYGRLTRSTGLPLAGGDLDGDGLVDFVLPTEIKLSSPEPLVPTGDAGAPPVLVQNYRGVKARDQLRWTAARIGRFNNDDLPDVLVQFKDSLDVDVMGNAGGGRFTPFTVRSEQIVRSITSGDFDGDRIEDVGFFQSQGPLENGDEATLTVAFGSAVGGPADPRTAGKFKYALGAEALRESSGSDNLAVLQIVPDGAGSQTSYFSVLFGSGGRQQVAPLFLTDPDLGSGRLWQPVSFSVVRFTVPGAPSQKAILSVAASFVFKDEGLGRVPTDFRTAVWVAPPDPAAVGGLAPFSKLQDLDETVGFDLAALQAGRRQLKLITAIGDLNADGNDDIVNIGQAGETVAISYVQTTDDKPKPPTVVSILQKASVDEGDPLELIDVDRDGSLDLVYIVTVDGRRALSVLRGNGQGAFVSTPITTAGTALKANAIRFAKIDTGAVTKIAVVTDSQLWLVELKDGQLVATDVSRVLGPAPAGITAIVGGDINGDGVPDLAIAQGGGIRVILQKPRNP